MSTEDQLLEALAASMREGPDSMADEERLEALSRGELSPDEVDALRSRAEKDPALARAVDAHTPLDDAARENFTHAALEALGAPSDADDKVRDPQAPTSSGSSSPRRGPLRYVPWLLPLVAAAMVWLLLRPAPAPPLPDYRVAVLADASVRSDPGQVAATPTLSPGSRLRLVLTPAEAVTGEVVARVAVIQAGETQVLTVVPEVAATGAVKLEEQRTKLFGVRSGDVVLRVVVGRPENVDEGLTAVASQGDGWRRYDTAVRLLP